MATENKTSLAHTQGPWSQGHTLLTAQTKKWSKKEWELNEAREQECIFAWFSASDAGMSRQPIARVMRQSPEWEANARLIAAAPELLESLKEAIEQCAGFGNDATVARWKKAVSLASLS